MWLIIVWCVVLAVLATAGAYSIRRLPTPRIPTLITRYPEKVTEVTHIWGVAPSTVQRISLFLPTWELDRREHTIAWLAKKRVLQVPRHVPFPHILEESSMELENMHGLPGHGIRDIVSSQHTHRRWAGVFDGSRAVAKLAVAVHLAPDQPVLTFCGSQEGAVVSPRRGTEAPSGSIGWDEIFAPDGFRGRSLADLHEAKHLVNIRLQMYLSIKDILFPAPEGGGVFETHLTVALPAAAKNSPQAFRDFRARFVQVCADHRVRPLVILEQEPAARGTQIQLQTACYRKFPSVAAAVAAAHETGKSFSRDGFVVARTRVEAMALSNIPPKHAADLAKHRDEHRSCYFEFHRRVCADTAAHRLHADAEVWLERQRGRCHIQVHASQAPGKVYLNARMEHVGKQEAFRLWKSLETHVKRCTHVFAKPPLCEYAVFDDNPEFDHTLRGEQACGVASRLFHDVARKIL